MAKGKVSGFITALILAVVSFLVVFFFFPKFSEKYLGISFGKNGSEITRTVREKGKEVIDDVTDKVSDVVVDAIKAV